MLESEINLIADKIGMSITQLYEMNLHYQQFVVMQNTVSLIAGIVTFLAILCYAIHAYKPKTNMYEDPQFVFVITLIVGALIAFFVSVLMYIIMQGVVLPMQYPEYTAMIQTVKQIGSII